jgi:hypothetical protein
MYCLYNFQRQENTKNFQFYKETHLFGRNKGLIAQILKEKRPCTGSIGCKWQINLENDLPVIGLESRVIVVDLKPYATGNLSLYELVNVFGYSFSGWTPMMLHLKTIFVDEEGHSDQKKAFEISEDRQENVFTFAHVMDGWIKNGELIGIWTPPRPSSTNSALLWDDVFEYFIQCKRIVNSNGEH